MLVKIIFIKVLKSPLLLKRGLMNMYVGGQLLQLLRACHTKEDYNFLYIYALVYYYCLRRNTVYVTCRAPRWVNGSMGQCVEQRGAVSTVTA
jgi:hypothetical protein